LTEDAKRRLEAMEMFTELGSGFNIAMQDLDIRGAGNLLGVVNKAASLPKWVLKRTHRILEEAMAELQLERTFSCRGRSRSSSRRRSGFSGRLWLGIVS